MAELEYVTMANHAEALNGLLYLSGAGWTDATIPFQPTGQSMPFHFGIGVSVLVPWTETSRPHRLILEMEHEDGGDPVFSMDGELQVGRPIGIAEGSDQRAVLAVSGEVAFPREGGYRLRAELSGGSSRSLSIRIAAANGTGTGRLAS